MNEVEKLAPDAKRARQKLSNLTGRKTHHSVDTEFGVLTVDTAETTSSVRGRAAKSKPNRKKRR